MRQVVRRIISLSREIPTMDNIIETRGNLDFIEILNSYPEFVEGVKGFEKKKRGRPTDNPSPEEVEYLVHLVESLYIEKGKTYTRDDRRKLKDLLNRAVDGADFFDPIKSKHWIDMFSALDHKLHIFSKEDNGNFSNFFVNYITLYSKLNTKKIVPFYARWIKEIAAMYTIYLNETFDEFEKTRVLLQDALSKGISQNSRERILNYETNAIRNYIMTNIFMAYGKNKQAVLSKLCDYIIENPDEFVYESGEINSRYRRYYFTIKEALRWITNQAVLSFANDELINVFLDDKVNYDIKDQKIRGFEFQLVNAFLELSQRVNSKKQPVNGVNYGECFPLTEKEKVDLLEFYVKERARFDEKTNTQIVLEIDELPFERQRTIEEVVDCVVKLLRLMIMLIIIYQGLNDENNEYEIPSSEDVYNDINQVMEMFGLLPLPAFRSNSYNDKSFLDFCVVKCIEESFEEA